MNAFPSGSVRPIFNAAFAFVFLTFSSGARAGTSGGIREPAVAGLFYPKDATELARTLEACLATAKGPVDGDLRALIVPHAGYAYSGPVAANAYRLLASHDFTTVVVMGPSHYAVLSAASISGADAYRTPLGDVTISPKARVLAKIAPFAMDAPATVQRPNWWPQSSRGEPPSGQENADTWEHSVEVEIPFLQKTLGAFSLVPVVMGEIDTEEAAHAIEQIIDHQTLVVASSDLSHYHSYAKAKARDQACVDAILNLDTQAMARQEACGLYPILTLLHLAQDLGWKPRLLDLRNSGDIGGEKNSVVGYAAIAFFSDRVGSGDVDTLTPQEGRLLLQLARDTIKAAASHRPPPATNTAALPPELKEIKSCFVTLNEHGRLRGCIGHLGAREPLYQDVIENARAAALEDPRFSPVTAKEADELEIEVSVLTSPTPLPFNSPEDLVEKLQPQKDGVVLHIGRNSATYLPQVWDQIGDKIAFLNTLAEKAGCEPAAWRGPDVSVSTYRVQSFREVERGK